MGRSSFIRPASELCKWSIGFGRPLSCFHPLCCSRETLSFAGRRAVVRGDDMGRADGGWCLGNVLGVLQIDPPMLRRENNCSFFEQSSVDLDQASLLARLILKLRL